MVVNQNKMERIAPEGRRLDKGMRPAVSKYANNNVARDEGKRLAELERSRDKLGGLIESYAKLLTDTTLPENRSAADKEKQRQILDLLPKAALELDTKNLHEGTSTVLAAALSSVFILRDGVNKLKYQIYFLNQKVEKFKTQIVELGAAPVEDSATINELTDESKAQ